MNLELLSEDFEDEELVADRDMIFRNLIRNFKTVNDSEFEIPKELKGVLRSYGE